MSEAAKLDSNIEQVPAIVTRRWRATVILSVLVFVAVVVLFRTTAQSMVYVWYNFETYTHGFVVLPISLWLIWHKRAHLAVFAPEAAPWFLLVVAGGLVVWLLARLTGVLVVEQFAFVTVLAGGLAAIIGWRVAKFLAFPLLFLYFAVPMGEDLVPPMMEFTATFTVEALRLTGIPVYREGLWFSLPTGNWSVVEACSGVRYLIASATLGVMYAYITYHTLWKRLLFIALSVLVPVLANGLRAYIIVIIGHFSDMKYATGVDHLIYGWFFFGVVMLILFWIGSHWRETELPPTTEGPAQTVIDTAFDARAVSVALLVVLMAAGAVWWARQTQDVQVQLVGSLNPPSTAGGWSLMEMDPLWSAAHQPTPHKIEARYARVDGEEAQLFVILFPHQRQGNEAINADNVISDSVQRLTRLAPRDLALNGSKISINRFKLTISVDGESQEHRVWHWYRVAGRSLTNRYEGKAWEALARIYPGRADGAWIAITTPLTSAGEDAAEERLAEFAEDMAPQVDAALDAVLGFAD